MTEPEPVQSLQNEGLLEFLGEHLPPGGDPELEGVFPDHPEAEGMEGVNLHRGARREEFPGPVPHLGGGLLGKGQGEDPVGGNLLFPDKVGELGGGDPCLSGAGAGKDDEGAVRMFHRPALVIVQFVREGCTWLVHLETPTDPSCRSC